MARELSETLEAAQKLSLVRWPYLIAKIRRRWGGVIRYDWENLYSGAEYNGPHCVTMPSDGSLIRLRVTESGDNRKLYYQRVTSPGEASDYSTWTYLEEVNVIAVASCAYGTNVFQCYIDSDRKLWWRESADSGASWGSWSQLGTTATTGIYGFSAAYKPNGDVGMFWIDQATVYRMRRISGGWESKAAWDKTTGTLSGIAVYYNEDWNLVITGQDSSDKWTVWTIIYGDGERQAANTWSDLKIIIQRSTTEPYEYHAPSIGRPDTTRLFFVENFTQAENLNHVWYSHMPPSPHFDEEAWLEPVPMEPQETMGLAFCQYGSYAWLTNAGEVYRALATDDELDIASKLLTLDMRQYPDIRKGYVRIAVDNTAGIYSNFARLGDELTIGLGYKTASGNEYSLTSSFWITEHKLISPSWSIWRSLYPYGVLGTLNIEAQDAWDFLKRYKARRALSWAADEKSITELLQYFFARSGLDFEVQSASDAATNFKPEFSVRKSISYRTIIKNLMKMIPDQLIFREAKVILRNPTTAEAVDWTYHNTFGTAILVFRGKYGTSAWDPSRVEVWTDTEMKEAAEWPQVARMRDRLARVTTPTYPDLTRAEERADAELRKAEILTGEESWIQTGVNCGLEPWDKLQITDLISGVEDIYRRAIRIRTKWDKRSWNYHQVLVLGAD